VASLFHPDTNLGKRALWGALLGAALATSAGGCASTWDEVTSREFKFSALFSKEPDPLVVIRDSTDGERRGKALASLREPLRNGGTAKDQEVYLEILSRSAREDRDPICRIGAVQALGNFRDPRAARVLEEVYQQPKLPFTQDFNAMLRQHALRSLEKAGDEEARHLLVRVARQPPPASDANSIDRQQTQDEKVIAIRALGRYKQPECVETLVYILETEKDNALRDRAHESLQSATGRTLPPDATAWRQALATPQPAVAPEPTIIQRVSGWVQRK
jgi:PBS lyase HEAT-like repeat